MAADPERYFPASHPELSAALDLFMANARHQLGALGGVEAFVLAGGYGRGEGGVLVGDDGREHLYNDLEFYLFTKGIPTAALRHGVHQIEREGSRALELEVEIRMLPSRALRRAVPSMFFYDLFWGHRVVYGPEDFVRRFTPDAVRDEDRIPLHEATRLLFNRGSGLLFAAAKLGGIDPDRDIRFIQRNHAKLKLALGDAWLAAHGEYHWSCVERNRRLKKHAITLPNGAVIQGFHDEGVQFKLHPAHPMLDDATLRAQQQRLVALWTELFLWLEGKRLQTSFSTLSSYVHYAGRVLPEMSLLKAVLCHLRDILRYRGFVPRWRDYPRATLQRALAGALASQDMLDGEGGAGVLSVSTSSFLAEYRRWWSRYH